MSQQQILLNLASELDEANKTIDDLRSSLRNLFNELQENLPKKDFDQLLCDSFTIRTLYSTFKETEEELNFEDNYLSIKDTKRMM